MSTNAWFQFNTQLLREGYFKDVPSPSPTESPGGTKCPTFGEWLEQEWSSCPEIPYPTPDKKINKIKT